VGDLPPSSSVTRFIVSAPSRIMVSPTATEPVNEILSTFGLRTSSAPTTSPWPVTTFGRPFGSLADEFLAFLGDAQLVAHNAGFDICACSKLPSLRALERPMAMACCGS
jgi:hypothetical protein